MKKRIDLHTHSDASDGIYSPIQLIDYAKKNNITTLALTDHDTVAGISSAMDYAGKIGFDLVPGIEFSIDYSGGSLHLIGLYIDFQNSDLIDTVHSLQLVRENRVIKIIEDLNKHGIEISIEEITNESRGSSIGKPHIARAMMKLGYGNDVTEIFKNYMIKGKPGYIKKENIKLEEAVSITLKSGGIPILAHPISLNFKSFEQFESMLKDMVQVGVKGMEVYSSMHSKDEVNKFLTIAKKYKLIISGGSDFHGDKNEKIGFYSEDDPIPIEIYDEILEYVT